MTTVAPPEPSLGDQGQRRRAAAVAGVTAYVIVVAWWGESMLSDGRVLHLGAPPFYGSWREGGLGGAWPGLWWPALLGAAGLAVAIPGWWVGAARRVRWAWVLLGSWGWAVLWSTTLAATDGPLRLAEPLLDHRYEYLPWARELTSPGDFVAGFVQNLSSMPTHVRGHPPGAVLAFWGLDRLFPSDRGVTMALLVIAGTAAPAALLAVRAVSDEDSARRAAPFLGLAPAAIWIATSADALIAAVAAWSIALAALATASRGRRSLAYGAAAGLLAGTAASLSYGAVVLLGPLIALGVAAGLRRSYATLGAIGAGALVVPAAFLLAGFDWVEGAGAVREQYLAGVGSSRPWTYFLFSNVAAFAVAAGPAAVAGVATLRDRRLWWLVGGALAGVAAADLSGMSKGEVERIWLPVVPWVVIATASIRVRRSATVWAALTMGATIVLQWQLRSPW